MSGLLVGNPGIIFAPSFPHSTSFHSGPPPLTSCPGFSYRTGWNDGHNFVAYSSLPPASSRATVSDDAVAFAVSKFARFPLSLAGYLWWPRPG